MGVCKEIENLAAEMKRIKGVVGVVLFGSYSRGEQDEGSDIDLLTIFRDGESLKENQEQIYKMTAKRDLFLHVITLTIEELRGSQLLKSVMREGEVYHANEDVRKLLSPLCKAYALITYRTANLEPKDRVTFIQRFEGRGRGKYKYRGLIHQLNGYKVGRGVAMIPIENLKKVIEYFDREGIEYVIRYVYA